MRQYLHRERCDAKRLGVYVHGLWRVSIDHYAPGVGVAHARVTHVLADGQLPQHPQTITPVDVAKEDHVQQAVVERSQRRHVDQHGIVLDVAGHGQDALTLPDLIVDADGVVR